MCEFDALANIIRRLKKGRKHTYSAFACPSPSTKEIVKEKN